MRLWPWEFLLWAGREWNLVQDTYWWAYDAMPLAGTSRKQGLLRHSVKLCVWLGPPDCYRDQDRVLKTPSETTSARDRADMAMRTSPIGRRYRNGRIAGAADERGGADPVQSLAGRRGDAGGYGGTSGGDPRRRGRLVVPYLLPEGGVLLDPFCGIGHDAPAALDHGASASSGSRGRRSTWRSPAAHRGGLTHRASPGGLLCDPAPTPRAAGPGADVPAARSLRPPAGRPRP